MRAAIASPLHFFTSSLIHSSQDQSPQPATGCPLRAEP